MLTLKRFFGSIYARFLFAFIGAFFITMLIPAIGMNFLQASRFEVSIQNGVIKRAENMRELITHGVAIADAARLLKTSELRIETISAPRTVEITLTPAQKTLAERGEIVSQPPAGEGLRWFALFKSGGTWIYIHPNYKSGLFVMLRYMQIYLVVVPIILGTVLIFLAAITVAKPIKRLSVASRRVAAGDLTVQLPVKGSGELGAMADNFNYMVRKLSENEYLHKEFVSNVSHEFNTPITSLMGYAKLLKRKSQPEEKRDEYADIIIYESDRLSRLCKDLLRLSELENSGEIADKETFSLDEQMREAVVLLQHAWEDKNIGLELDLDEISFSGDKALMYHVWINILSNAVKYTNRNGKIKISLRQNGCITATISDNGIGMSQEQLKKAFVRFYKADSSRNSSGSGLGLSIAKKIVELHKGDIQVESREKEGTTFTVRLPKG